MVKIEVELDCHRSYLTRGGRVGVRSLPFNSTCQIFPRGPLFVSIIRQPLMADKPAHRVISDVQRLFVTLSIFGWIDSCNFLDQNES